MFSVTRSNDVRFANLYSFNRVYKEINTLSSKQKYLIAFSANPLVYDMRGSNSWP